MTDPSWLWVKQAPLVLPQILKKAAGRRRVRSPSPSSFAPQIQRLWPQPKKECEPPAYVALVAKALGTAQVTATVQGLTQSRRIDVTATPLPVDSIRIRSGWSAFDSLIGVVHDSTGQLVELTLPMLGYAVLETRIFRGDQWVTIMTPSWTMTSSDPTVAWVDRHCRAAIVDPQCELAVAWENGWVTGLAPGTASVTVTARNIQRSFGVTVQ